MQTYPTFCTLKKDWTSFRGRCYPAGTIFKRNKDSAFSARPEGAGHWYEFRTPRGLPFPHQNSAFGFLFIPNKIFFQLTEEEKELKEIRKKLREEHIKAHRLFFDKN